MASADAPPDTATDTPPEGVAAGAAAGWREWTGLAVLALPTLLLALDISVLYLALPTLSASLGASGTEQLWIMDIYTFMLAGFLIPMGSLGDRIGRRRLLLIGASAFGLASAAAAYAATPALLIGARAVMGIAGATLMPSTLALLTTMFRDRRQRATAIGVWASCMMVGAAVGPVIGGVLLDAFWWGSVLLMGVPVMVVLLVTAPALLPESRDVHAGRLDLLSVGILMATILPIIFGLKEIAAGGRPQAPILAIVIGVVAGVVFVRRQRRLTHPLVDVRLFRNRSYSTALAIIALGAIPLAGTFLLVSQHLQLVNDLSSTRAGWWLAPVCLAVAVGAMTAPAAARRLPPATVIAAGLALSTIGSVALTQVDGAGDFPLLVGGTVVLYLGVGPSMALGVDMVLGSSPPEKAGATSATSEASTELGAALGIALLGSLAAAVYRGRITVPAAASSADSELARESLPGALAAARDLTVVDSAELLASAHRAFTAGLNVTALVGAVMFAALFCLAVTVPRDPRAAGKGT